MNKLKQTNSDLVYTDLEVVDEKLQTVSGSYWKLKSFDKKIIKYNNFDSLYLNNYITGCTILAKSKWISEILPLPKESKYILHDYWIALIISQKGIISYLDKPTLKYRQHTDNSVGAKKVSEKMNKLENIRSLFIDVKIEHFQVFVAKQEFFDSKKIRELNKKALKYYHSLEEVKFIKLSGIFLFFKLYKYESFGYKVKNLIILHFPGLVNKIFNKIKEKK